MKRLRLRQLRWRSEGGYSLIELLTVMTLMTVIMASLTALFTSGANAEFDLNNRFQAQQTARVALDKLRREAHCAQSASATTPAYSVTLTFDSSVTTSCGVGSTTMTWCTRAVSGSTTRFALWRVSGSSCGSSGGARWADYLTPSSTVAVSGGNLPIFTFTDQTTTSLATLHVDMPVNVKTTKTVELYELIDDLVLRNSCRRAAGTSCS